jgi:hypothetical protein
MLNRNELNDLNTRVTFNINAKFLELFRSYYPKTYQKQIRRLMEEDIEKKEKIEKEELAKRNKYLNMNRYY